MSSSFGFDTDFSFQEVTGPFWKILLSNFYGKYYVFGTELDTLNMV